MADLSLTLAFTATLLWLLTILLPWQSWRTNEVLESNSDQLDDSLADVTVVIPARNEAQFIGSTLQALSTQGTGLQIIVVDDASSDATATIAAQSEVQNLKVLTALPLAQGWTGKLCAQEQGIQLVSTAYTLLLDADIVLKPGIVKSLQNKMQQEDLQFVSLMAMLRCHTTWEKLLMPAFIYFFKLLYPFALANKPGSRVAAAAGGCILIETEALRKIGGMHSLKHAVIDDCTLAKKFKNAGFKTWLGLTKSVVSQRPYDNLGEIWEMVARTAYTQLYYSVLLLLACTSLMALLYWLPLHGLLFSQNHTFLLNLASMMLMFIAFQPTLKFYSLSPLWAIALPLVAGLYLLMTWSSAIRYWQGQRSRWKGRVYQRI